MITKSYLKRNKTGYGTDLTDKQWQVIENLLDDKERKRKHSLRFIFNDILYWIKIGYTSF
ncbi:transposase [Bacteroides faecichinchillae]|nr:transposase [Bacteroides faecichinchillae]